MNTKITDSTWCAAFQLSHFPSALLDKTLRIVACNQAYEALVNQSERALIGSSVISTFWGIGSEQARSLIASCTQVYKTAEPHCLPLFDFHLRDEKRFISIKNTPIMDEAGSVSLILTQPVDITDLTRFREEFSPFSDDLTRSTWYTPETRFYSVDQVKRLLHAERKRMERFFEEAPGFVCILSGENHVYEMANNAYYQLVGHRDIIGHELANVLPEVVPQGFLDKLNNVYLTGAPFTGRAVPILLQRTPGGELEQCYIDLMYQPIHDDVGRVSGIFVQGHDVTDAYRLSLEVAHQASHDPLTGLANRRLLAQVGEALDATDTNHALLYLDLDHFKIINDRCGHRAGDELLVQMSQVLTDFVGKDDTLARVGGDEFVLVLKECAEFVALEISNQIRHAVENLMFAWESNRYGITLSVGLVCFGTTKGIDFEKALSLADSACFLAKEKGRNRVQTSKPDDEEIHRQHTDMDWASRIKEAIANDRITLWGQKIVGLSGAKDKRRIEVLSRLITEDGQLIPPGAFIPGAERFGMVEQLDYHIIEKVFEHLDRHSDISDKPSIFVNLSGATLSSENVSERIIAIADKFPSVANEQICFEVTETSAITNIARAADAMSALVASGFTFALDDFGSGMSSFSYLERLPVAYVKIDGEFIQRIETSVAGEAIVEAVTHVAKTMGIITIAEYVEHNDQIPALTRLGVDFGQGYGIHRPEPLDALFSGEPSTHRSIDEARR